MRQKRMFAEMGNDALFTSVAWPAGHEVTAPTFGGDWPRAPR